VAERDLAWIGLGCNLGDRLAHLGAATGSLAALATGPLVVSPIYETEPWGVADQPAFLNGVVGLEFDGEPLDLLDRLQAIEAAAGRLRMERWGPRTLDLDLLAWGDRVSSTDRLTLPHPRLSDRRFVLAPWAEVAPDLRLPGLTGTLSQLLGACPDLGSVTPLR
jgi:2-amino-4-hydroxy-6-hydroxymethyldihydropteridine diphosphokinase